MLDVRCDDEGGCRTLQVLFDRLCQLAVDAGHGHQLFDAGPAHGVDVAAKGVEQRVSRQFGVVYNNPLLEHGLDYAQGIPLPASFLVDKKGVIRYVSRPDRVGEFLNPELIFGVLESMPDTASEAWVQKRA